MELGLPRIKVVLCLAVLGGALDVRVATTRLTPDEVPGDKSGSSSAVALLECFFIIALLLGILLAARRAEPEAVEASDRQADMACATEAPRSKDESASQEADILKFEHLAEAGELDQFTIMAISNHLDHFGIRTRSMMPGVLLLMLMQFMVPALLLAYQVNKLKWYTTVQDRLLRVLGFILMGYSTNEIYSFALDESRTFSLEVGVAHHASWWFLVPVLIGEFVNAFTSLALICTLFLVFCEAETAFDLIANCVAVNFIGNLDSSGASGGSKVVERAISDFRVLRAEWEQSKLAMGPGSSRFSSVVHFAMKHTSTLIRVAGCAVLGSCCAFLFLLANEERLCELMSPSRPWPICVQG